MDTPGELHITCWKGQALDVERSADLEFWIMLGSATNQTGSLTFRDSGLDESQSRFYRVKGK